MLVAGCWLLVAKQNYNLPINTITESTASDGSHSWTIPSNVAVGTTYKIKITSISDNSVHDFSNTTFTITEPIPTTATLVFPSKDATCTEGTILSDEESNITFQWNAGTNTDLYQLDLKNLLTSSIESHTTIDISKSNSTSDTAQSETWKFYAAGVGIESYAPFPAEIVFPKMGEIITSSNSVITLDWNSSDTDNDIVGHDIYFGTTIEPGIFKNDVLETSLNDVPISSGTTYYWKVITKDAKGNISDSGIYQFTIN